MDYAEKLRYFSLKTAKKLSFSYSFVGLQSVILIDISDGYKCVVEHGEA
jgi:hypothetical protein